MPRRLLPAGLVLALLLLAAAAPAASAAKVASVRLTACDLEARTADFAADMRAVAGATRLQLRFTLQVHEERAWERVAAPTFDTWATAAPGRTRWIYDKHVENLGPGAYRVAVRFRWRAADGTVVRSATKRSRACRVPDPRPDLAPEKIAVKRGPGPDGRTYVVTVVNDGLGPAGPFAVALAVDGVPLEDVQVEALEAGRRARASFVGPVCPPGGTLVSSVDASSLVDEADEADDTLSVPCTGA